jgi:hypothetical protein
MKDIQRRQRHFLEQQQVEDKQPLHHEVRRLIRQLEIHAGKLNKRRCSTNEQTHWQARGQQEMLRRASAHLRRICAHHNSISTLSLALKDYLGCLEKYEIDAEEKKRSPAPGKKRSVQQWQAEGVVRALSTISANLDRLVDKHVSSSELHRLSFDGSILESCSGDDEEKDRAEQGDL